MRSILRRPVAICFFLFFGLIPMFSAFGQTVGDLDTTFRCLTNYGALYRVEKAWSLADGSVLCYQQGPNYFSGVKTGSFFKIRPNGDLDTSYHAPEFYLQCVWGFCTCYDYPEYFWVDSIGTTLLLTGDNVYINGLLSSKKNFRLSPSGEVDINLSQENFSMWELNPSPFLTDGRVLGLYPDSLRLYKKKHCNGIHFFNQFLFRVMLYGT